MFIFYTYTVRLLDGSAINHSISLSINIPYLGPGFDK